MPCRAVPCRAVPCRAYWALPGPCPSFLACRLGWRTASLCGPLVLAAAERASTRRWPCWSCTPGYVHEAHCGLKPRPACRSAFAVRSRAAAMAKVAHARACAHTRAPHQTPDAVCTRAHMRHCLPVCQGLSFMSMWVHIPLTRRSVCGDSEAAEEADHTVETWEAWNRPASPQPRKASSFGYRFALIVDRPSARPRPPAADAAKRCAAAAKRWPERLRRRERNGGFCFQRSARLVPARAFARGGWLCMPHTTRHAAANDPRQSRARTHARPLVLVFRALPTDRPGFKPRLPECGVCGVGWCCALTHWDCCGLQNADAVRPFDAFEHCARNHRRPPRRG